MKPNQKNRYNGRYNSRSPRTNNITRNTALESSGPMGKVHGTALQLFEKYQSYAKDALIQNDLILAQTCMQYADHYMRMQNIAIANEQAMRPQAAEPRPLQNAADRSDSDSQVKEEGEEAASETVEQPVAPSESALEAQSAEETLDDGASQRVEKEKPIRRKPFAPRRRTKSASVAEEKEDSLPDEEILKRDLSVPILVMQSNNQ